jgi:hypothetical protein
MADLETTLDARLAALSDADLARGLDIFRTKLGAAAPPRCRPACTAVSAPARATTT